MKTKIFFPDMLYYIAVFLTAISSTLIGATYLFLIPNFNPIVKYGALFFFCLYFLAVKWNRKGFIGTLFIIIITFLCAFLIDNTTVLLYFLMIILAGKQNFNNICKFLIITNLLLIFLIIVLCCIGILNDNVVVEGGKIAHSIGFAHYSTLAYHSLFFFIIGYYLIEGKRKEAKKILWLLTGFCLNILVFKITTVRLAFFCVCLFIICAIFIDLLDVLRYFNLNLLIATIMYPTMFFLSILFPFIYTKNGLLVKFDELLSGRLMFGQIAFQRYDITLFGQLIITDAGGINENGINTYFFIDSGYVNLLLQKGIILCVLIVLAYTLISRYAVKTNNRPLFIWCILVCIFSFVNDLMISTVINPLLLMAPIILVQSKDKYFMKSRHMLERTIGRPTTKSQYKLAKNS